MFAKIIRNIERKAHRATPQHYRLVFFDIRVSGVATEWQQVRVGWITGSQRETWCSSRTPLCCWHHSALLQYFSCLLALVRTLCTQAITPRSPHKR